MEVQILLQKFQPQEKSSCAHNEGYEKKTLNFFFLQYEGSYQFYILAPASLQTIDQRKMCKRRLVAEVYFPT